MLIFSKDFNIGSEWPLCAGDKRFFVYADDNIGIWPLKYSGGGLPHFTSTCYSKRSCNTPVLVNTRSFADWSIRGRVNSLTTNSCKNHGHTTLYLYSNPNPNPIAY